MRLVEGLREEGIRQALGAALLFGAATPFAKLLLNTLDPWQLAGLLYLGSGIGLTAYRAISSAPSIRLSAPEWAGYPARFFSAASSRPFC